MEKPQFSGNEHNRTRIILRPEYGASLVCSSNGPMNVEDLQLSLELRRDLARWVREWDSSYVFDNTLFGLDASEEVESIDDDETEAAFVARGLELARRIQSELGESHVVALDL